MALISVILPVHDRVATVQRAIDSVLCQRGADLELLAVDDGSTDGSSEILRSVDDPRVRVFTRPTASGGPAVPRNVALGHARGDWVAFLDDDDYWLEDKLLAQLGAVTETGADLVYSRCLVADHRLPGQLVDYHERFQLAGDELPGGQVTGRLIERNFVPTLTTLVRRSSLQRVGSFNPARSGVDDYEMWLRLALAGCRFTPVDEPTGVYAWRPTGLSQRMHRHALHLAMFRELAREHPEHETSLTARRQLAHRAQARRQIGAASSHLRALGRPDERSVPGHLGSAARALASAVGHQAAALGLGATRRRPLA